MVKVIATTKGYFGGVIRDYDDSFEIPDEVWKDKKRRPSWVKLDPAHAFGGKGDHDGDGSVGGSKPADAPAAEPATGKGKGKGKAKAETVDAQSSEPFKDAPEPETAQGNGVVEALGGAAPDWVAPDTGQTAPVMADD